MSRRVLSHVLRGRYGKLLVSVVVGLAVAGGAFAYFSSQGTGSATASVGTLNAATISAPSTSGASITITWTSQASMNPSSENSSISYTVQRKLGSGGSYSTLGSGSCGGSLPYPTSACTDTVTASGTYFYEVVAHYGGNAWTAISNEVSTAASVDTTPPTTSLSLVSPSHAFMAGSGPYTLYYKGDTSGSFRVADAVSDSGSGPASASFPGISATGWSGHTAAEVVTSGTGSPPTITYTSSGSQPYQWNAGAANPIAQTLTAKDVAGNPTDDTVNFVSDTTPPAGGALTVAGTAATGAGSTATNNTGNFNIGAITDYTDAGSGLASSTLTVQSAAYSSTDGIAAGTCGTFGSATAIASRATPIAQTRTTGCYLYTLTGTDNVGNTTSVRVTVEVDTTAPSTPSVTVSSATGNTFISGSTVYLNTQTGKSGGFTAGATSTDNDSGIQKITFPALTGFSGGGGDDTGSPYSTTYAWSGAVGANGAQTITAVNEVGLSANKTSAFTLVHDITAPTGGGFTANGTAASAGGSSSFITSGTTLTITGRTDYSETQSATQSGLASSVLTIQSATLANNACGTFGASTTISGTASQTVASGNCYLLTLTGTDNVGNSASVSTTVKVDTTAPSTPTLAFSGLTNAFYGSGFNTIYFRPASGGAFTVAASSTDAETGIKSGNAGYTFSSLSGNNFTGTQTAGQESYTFSGTATQPASAATVFSTNNAGLNSANASYTLKSDTTAPTGGGFTANGTAATGGGSTSSLTSGTTLTINSRTDYGETQSATASGLASSVLTIQSATLSNNTCGTFGSATTISGTSSQTVASGNCYLLTLTGTDNVGNTTSVSTTVKVDTAPPSITVSVIGKSSGGTPGFIKQGGSYFIYANATDAASGVNTVTANVSNITTGATSVALTSTGGPFTVGGTSYTYRSASQTANASLAAGTSAYSVSATDNAGNSATNSSFSVTVDNTAPSGSDIQMVNGGGTPGMVDSGDVITYTFSEPMDPNSIKSGWDGTSTPVTVSFNDNGSNDNFTVASTNLGTVTMGGDYQKSTQTAGGNMVLSANTVTITLTNSPPPGQEKTVASSTMTWVPSSSATDRAGNACSTATVTESGAPKQNAGFSTLPEVLLSAMMTGALLGTIALLTMPIPRRRRARRREVS